MKPRTKMGRKMLHIVRTLRCGYCGRVFHGRVSLYNKHVRNHEKKYAKHWSKINGEKTGAVIDEKTDIDSPVKRLDDESGHDEVTREAGLQPVRERLYVYIVHAPSKPACECNKENQRAKMPCDCDYTFNRMVYSSVAQMHRSLRDGVGYDCKQCKKKVLPSRYSDVACVDKSPPCSKCSDSFNGVGYDCKLCKKKVLQTRDSEAGIDKAPPTEVYCGKCGDSFSTQYDLEVHQQVCLGFKKTGQVFKCLQCSTKLDRHKDMVLHASLVHAEDDHSTDNIFCPVCDKRYATSKLLKTHLQSHPEYAKRGNVCSVCGLQCGDAAKLKKHARLHEESKRIDNRKLGLCKDDLRKKLSPERQRGKSDNSIKVSTNRSAMTLRQRKQHEPSMYVDDDDDDLEIVASDVNRSITSVPNLKFKCKHCERAFTSSAFLQIHNRQTHLGSEPYICLICKRRFSDQALFKLHREMHTETFKCKFCKASFDNPELLHNHDQAHGVGEGKCAECPVVFSDSQSLNSHLQTHAKKVDKDLLLQLRLKPALKPSGYPCKQCRKIFPSQSSLQNHAKLHRFDRRYPCSICKKSFPSQNSLKLHDEKLHRTESKYPCKYCAKVFDFESDHKIHESLHEEYDGKPLDVQKYKCKYCNKSLQHKTDLKLHEALHEANGRKDFACDQCDKVFMYKLELQQHRRNHFRDKIKPTKCPDCNKVFVWGKQLRDHKKTHWPEKPFLCVYCRVRFVTQEELTQHEPLHTKGKRHQCEICSRRFKDKRHIRDHMLIHTGEKPYPCRYCPKAFRQSSQRQTHERIHTHEASFVCEICNRGFLYWTSLRVHRKTHYKGKPAEEMDKLIRAPIMCKESKRRISQNKASGNNKTTTKKRASQGDQTTKRQQQKTSITNHETSTALHQDHVPQPATSSSMSHDMQASLQTIQHSMNIPIPLTIQSNEQMLQALPEHMASQQQQLQQQRPRTEESHPTPPPLQPHQPQQQQQMSAAVPLPGSVDPQWELMLNRYINNPTQSWQPAPPNWQGLPGTSTQPMPVPPNRGNWEMLPSGNWVGPPPPPAHQGHHTSSVITSAMYGIVQQQQQQTDNQSRVYQQ